MVSPVRPSRKGRVVVSTVVVFVGEVAAAVVMGSSVVEDVAEEESVVICISVRKISWTESSSSSEDFMDRIFFFGWDAMMDCFF